MNTVGITEKADVCPSCGKEIQFESATFGDLSRKFTIACDCDREEREQEQKRKRAEDIERGTAIFRVGMQIGTGIHKRQRKMTFDNFVPLDGQQEAFDTCRAYAEDWTEKTEHGLLISGPVGSGKTHLGSAICNAIIARQPVKEYEAERYISCDPDGPVDYGENGLYYSGSLRPEYSGMKLISSVSFLNRIKSAYDSKDEDPEDIMDGYKEIKLLVLDDLGAEKATDWALEKLFDLIDFRYNELLPIVATTNLTTLEMKDVLGDRIADRLRSMCKLVSITAPSQRITAK
ncbi:DNA replication protein DnaC [Sporobacter termitidis DSM 10068]|uniref:DNA replication protein DnaC n=1 Tax=Sporobacter termitidis DSM 10068 TaxID=1123282 RepID=A0A1M5ZKP8_9FIRM|nr:ATP-binding protein [Sporobacter termitidis]SHI24718.1 DNA replication protein DnaC [Sporobacter termitidis DSM 10068]